MQQVHCVVAPGEHLGSFPIQASFRIIEPDPSTGDLYHSIELIELFTMDGVKLAEWFWNLLSDNQIDDLAEQCGAQAT